MLSLATRLLADEMMDAPGLDARDHTRALAGLARINRNSRTAQQFAGRILPLARQRGLANISLLDVACGGGDVPIRVAQILERQGLALQLTLVDKSATALATARQAAARAGVHIMTVEGHAPDQLPAGPFDVVTNSLFLHHLPPDAVAATLRALHARARHLLIVSDLCRSLAGYWLAWLGTRVLSRSPIVHFDGPASVRAAFTPAELARLAEHAGVRPRIRRAFPCRMLLTVEISCVHESSTHGH